MDNPIVSPATSLPSGSTVACSATIGQTDPDLDSELNRQQVATASVGVEAHLVNLNGQFEALREQVQSRDQQMMALMAQLVEKSFSTAESATQTVSRQSNTILAQWNPKVILGAVVALLSALLASILGRGGR